MKTWPDIKAFFAQNSYGAFGTAVFLLVLFSGIILAIPYDAGHAYTSVSYYIIANPWADFSRNLHYWGAQAFLILILLHTWDHIKRNMLQLVSPGLWLRLCLTLIILFYAMLSGYFLKGDAEGLEAREILRGLTHSIPWIGGSLAALLVGRGQDLQLVYVHHIATASIFLALIIFEHSGRKWGKAGVFLISLAILGSLSLLLRAPLHDGLNPLLKGPWYFQGFQEILHWTSHPGWVLGTLLLLVLLIFFIRGRTASTALFLRKGLLLVFSAYALLSLGALFFRGPAWQFQLPWQSGIRQTLALPIYDPVFQSMTPDSVVISSKFTPVLGRYESCLACHSDMPGLSASHDPRTIGCVSCHGGNPFTVSKSAAHRGMRLIPGNLADATLSCGTANCHSDISQRIHSSIMTTVSGMISVNKWVFGEYDSPDSLALIKDIAHSPADEHLRNLCLGCHLGQDKKIPGPPGDLDKGGGCNACHLVYDKPAALAVQSYYDSKDPGKKLPSVHPNLSLRVTDDKCFSCHNRSGRISTSYEGYFETLRDPSVMEDQWPYKLVDGHRVFEKKEDDIHHRGGMSCIDCHNSYEMMGDGKYYRHKEEAVTTRCADCHAHKPIVHRGISGIDAESGKILAINTFLRGNNNFIRNQASGRIYVNTHVPDTGLPQLITKNSGKKLSIKPPREICLSSNAHKSLSCIACHASQAPTCLGCHNEYKSNKPGFDQVLGRAVKGAWEEASGTYGHRPPTLGVRIIGSKKEVVPFVPGMILTINRSSYPHSGQKDNIFRRLYAPIDPHTTAAKGRSCKSCHNDPVALGYGEGELIFDPRNGQGVWKFTPKYENRPEDGLPEDAWTGFLKERKDMASTRKNHRPFNLDEQRRILRVGACLSCHEESDKVTGDILWDFDGTVKRRSLACSVALF